LRGKTGSNHIDSERCKPGSGGRCSGVERSEESLRDLAGVLEKISRRLGSLEYVRVAVIYLAWAIWVVTLGFAALITALFNLPFSIYIAYLIASLVFMAFYVQSRLPRMLKLIAELERIYSVEAGAVPVSPGLYILIWGLSFIAIPLMGFLLGDAGYSTGLLVALGAGNTAMYILAKRCYRVLMKRELALSVAFFAAAALNYPVALVEPGASWFFASMSILLLYLLIALSLILKAFK